MSAIFDKVVTVSLQDFDARQAAAPRLAMSNSRRLNMGNPPMALMKATARCLPPSRSQRAPPDTDRLRRNPHRRAGRADRPIGDRWNGLLESSIARLSWLLSLSDLKEEALSPRLFVVLRARARLETVPLASVQARRALHLPDPDPA